MPKQKYPICILPRRQGCIIGNDDQRENYGLDRDTQLHLSILRLTIIQAKSQTAGWPLRHAPTTPALHSPLQAHKPKALDSPFPWNEARRRKGVARSISSRVYRLRPIWPVSIRIGKSSACGDPRGVEVVERWEIFAMVFAVGGQELLRSCSTLTLTSLFLVYLLSGQSALTRMVI
jgi:hypothetical protein